MNTHNLLQLLALPCVLVFLVLNLRNRLTVRLLLMAETSLTILLTIIPNASSLTARFLGCSSALAPILYMLVLLVASLAIVLIVRLRRTGDTITEIVRTIAIHDAEKMDEPKQ